MTSVPSRPHCAVDGRGRCAVETMPRCSSGNRPRTQHIPAPQVKNTNGKALTEAYNIWLGTVPMNYLVLRAREHPARRESLGAPEPRARLLRRLRHADSCTLEPGQGRTTAAIGQVSVARQGATLTQRAWQTPPCSWTPPVVLDGFECRPTVTSAER